MSAQAPVSSAPSLQIVIATCGADGLHRTAAMHLPRLPRVAWLVECQTAGGAGLVIPQVLRRPDVEVRFNATRGLSANRNMMLRDATAPYVMIADDDLEFSSDGIVRLLETMDANPGISLFCFRHDGPGRRRYPAAEKELRAYALRRHYPCSFEIALRVNDVRDKKLEFNELAGIGAPYLCAGEEDLFVFGLLKSGLRGRFYPFTVTTHRGLTTNDRNDSPAMWRTRGAVLRKLHPLTWPLRVIRHPRHLLHMMQGVVYACRL